MKKTVKSFQPRGEVQAPGSKSYMQRALVAALLAPGTTRINNPSFSHDGLAVMEAVKQLGAGVRVFPGTVEVRGGYRPRAGSIHCGESGLAMRMLAAVAALHDRPLTLTAGGSLQKRSMEMIREPLLRLGVSTTMRADHPPVTLRGPLRPGRAVLDGSESSQFLTGMLMALPVLEGDSMLEVANLKSKGYIDMTIGLLQDFGIRIGHEDYTRFNIPGNQVYKAISYTVEGDWSGAAFWLVAGCLGGPVKINGLRTDSLQADRRILEVVGRAGAGIDRKDGELVISRDELIPFTFDATDCPDLFPPLAVLAAFCRGTSRIRGVGRLRGKESDRAEALKTELGKTGLPVEIEEDWMIIHGGGPLKPALLDSHNDHRIAMAAALMAAGGTLDITITGTDSVKKSYPGFFEDLKKIGGKVYE